MQMKFLLTIVSVIVGQFLCAQNFVNFQENNHYGYKSIDGKIVIPAKFQYPADFHDGLALIREKTFNILVVDTAGKICFVGYNPRTNGNEYKHKFSQGLIAIYDTATKRYGFKNIQGAWAIPPKYYEVQDFQDGLAAVWENPNIHVDKGSGCGSPVEHPKWGYINLKGKYIIPSKYPEPGKRQNSRVVLSFYDKTEVYTSTGKKVSR
jgi:hypothetical protein